MLLSINEFREHSTARCGHAARLSTQDRHFSLKHEKRESYYIVVYIYSPHLTGSRQNLRIRHNLPRQNTPSTPELHDPPNYTIPPSQHKRVKKEKRRDARRLSIQPRQPSRPHQRVKPVPVVHPPEPKLRHDGAPGLHSRPSSSSSSPSN